MTSTANPSPLAGRVADPEELVDLLARFGMMIRPDLIIPTGNGTRTYAKPPLRPTFILRTTRSDPRITTASQ